MCYWTCNHSSLVLPNVNHMNLSHKKSSSHSCSFALWLSLLSCSRGEKCP